ncbi:MAG TPA: hypothetical protein VIE65_09870 [Methylobacter sp.]|jgi:hypothetical protein
MASFNMDTIPKAARILTELLSQQKVYILFMLEEWQLLAHYLALFEDWIARL